MKHLSLAKLMLAVSLLTMLPATGCAHPEPTAEEVEDAARSAYRLSTLNLVSVTNRIESVTLETTQVHGDNAVAHVSLVALEDDGSFGASCRNVLGCYRRVTKECDVSLAWSDGWVSTDRMECR